VPVVATATGGVPFVVTDGHDGLLVPPRNDAALAGAVNRLLHDPELASRLGRSGRETAARYAWAMLAERVLAVYRSVLGADAQGAG
jgi:glycosyltransferase involved in cell wall biosynthesis